MATEGSERGTLTLEIARIVEGRNLADAMYALTYVLCAVAAAGGVSTSMVINTIARDLRDTASDIGER